MLSLNVKQLENVSILYTKKGNTHLQKINTILYRSQRSFTNVSGKSTAQLTTSGKETVAACILKSSASTSSES